MFTPVVDNGRTKIVLDLTAVEEVSMMGMVAISFLFNKCRMAGGSLKISKLSPLVRRRFRVSNLINTVEVYEDVIDAIKSFRAHNLLKSKQFGGSFYLKERNSFVTWDRLPVHGLLN